MTNFYFVPQTAAEDDRNLEKCFYDKEYFSEISQYDYSFISGRKGMGKTALAKIIEKSADYLHIDHIERIPLLRDSVDQDSSVDKEKIMLYIIIKVVNSLIKKECIEKKSLEYWNSFLSQNDFHNPQNFQSFKKSVKAENIKLEPELKVGAFGSSVSGKLISYAKNSTSTIRPISESIDYLLAAIVDSFISTRKFQIYLDDLDTQIEDKESFYIEMYAILEHIQSFNRKAHDSHKEIRLILIMREDLLRFLNGSNKQKIESCGLKMKWDETDFYELISRRIEDEVGESAKKTVDRFFPNEFFTDYTKIRCKQYQTPFYTFMSAISFNRPRDFLQFCWFAIRKLPKDYKWSKESMDSILREFSAYLRRELKDELTLLCHKEKIQISSLDNFIRSFSKKENFTYKDFKNVKKNNSELKKLDNLYLLNHFIRYGVFGIAGEHYDYYAYNSDLPELNDDNDAADYSFCLHKGLKESYKFNLV